MKLKEEELVETSSNFEEDEINVEVDRKEADKLFDVLISSYKNIRAAFIRELVSNAWDAHKNIGVEEPVVVNMDQDDGGWFIEVIDKGVGMTDTFIRKTFSKLLKSTKTSSNEEIGGFGIGSKSPLGYIEQFYLSTIKDGFRNEYIIYRKDTGLPKISPTLVNDPTEDSCGTIVKVYLKQEETHQAKDEIYYYGTTITEMEYIANICCSELSFFDNVVFRFTHSKSKNKGENYNNGKIIEGKYFKYKTSTQFAKDFHIILGKVAYQIDWKELSLDPINIPVGIKFEIGELMVNMTRESIRYSDDAKVLIKMRINEAIQELADLYNSKNTIHTDIFEYTRALRQFEYDKKYELDFSNEYSIILNDISAKLNKPEFARFKDLPIKLQKGVSPYFFMYVANSKIEEGRERKSHLNVMDLCKEKYKVFTGVLAVETGKEFKKYIVNAAFLREQSTRSKTGFDDFLEKIGIKKHLTKKSIFKGKLLDDGKPNQVYEYPLGTIEVYIKYRKIVVEEVCKSLETIDYKNFEIPQEYKNEIKRIEKEKYEQYKLKNKISGVISIKNYNTGGREELDLSSLNKFTGTLIIGFQEDREDLEKITTILKTKKSYCYSEERKVFIGQYRGHYEYKNISFFKDKKIRIYQIAKNNIKLFYNVPFKVYHISQCMEISQIKRFITSLEIESNKNVQLKQEQVKLFNEYIAKLIKEVSKFDFENNSYQIENILRELVEKYKKTDEQGNKIELKIDPIIQWKLNQIDNYFKGAELTRYVNINDESLPYLIDYLKMKDKKVNINFYNMGKGIEEERPQFSLGITSIIREKTDLLNYNCSIAYIDPNAPTDEELADLFKIDEELEIPIEDDLGYESIPREAYDEIEELHDTLIMN